MSALYTGVRESPDTQFITDSFVCPDEKLDQMFSLKFTRLIGTPVDTDNTNNGHFCVSRGTDVLSHRSSTSPFL